MKNTINMAQKFLFFHTPKLQENVIDPAPELLKFFFKKQGRKLPFLKRFCVHLQKINKNINVVVTASNHPLKNFCEFSVSKKLVTTSL